MNTKTFLDRLVNSIITLRDTPVSREMRDKTQICILDYFAAACAGSGSATAHAGQNAAKSFGSGHCTMIGLNQSTSPFGAAFYNGLLGHAEEIDDSHRYTAGMHQGTTIIPAALALTEMNDSSGELLLKAIACGYEASGRIARCIDKGHRARGFHATGTIGPFGAAAACSVLLNLDKEGIANALGIAASTSAGLFAFLENGATVKHFHAGRPPMDGLLAALLAQGGMTAPKTIFEAKEGFFNAYATEYTDIFLDADLGAPEIMYAYHKVHSACGHSFPAIDAALALRTVLEEQKLTPDNLDHIEFKTYNLAAILTNQSPQTLQEARFSLPFVFSVALLKGSVTRAILTPEILHDEAVLAICHKVHIFEDPVINASFPRLRAGEMTAVTKNGDIIAHRVDSPFGMPDNPVSFITLEDKFRTEASSLFPSDVTNTIVELTASIHTAPSIKRLMTYLQCPFPEANK